MAGRRRVAPDRPPRSGLAGGAHRAETPARPGGRALRRGGGAHRDAGRDLGSPGPRRRGAAPPARRLRPAAGTDGGLRAVVAPGRRRPRRGERRRAGTGFDGGRRRPSGRPAGLAVGRWLLGRALHLELVGRRPPVRRAGRGGGERPGRRRGRRQARHHDRRRPALGGLRARPAQGRRPRGVGHHRSSQPASAAPPTGSPDRRVLRRPRSGELRGPPPARRGPLRRRDHPHLRRRDARLPRARVPRQRPPLPAGGPDRRGDPVYGGRGPEPVEDGWGRLAAHPRQGPGGGGRDREGAG